MNRRDLLATGTALAVLPLGSQPQAAPPTMQLGAQTHFAQGWSLDVLDRATALGLPLTFVRDEMFWTQIEPNGGGNYVVNDFIPIMAKLHALGLKLLFTAFNTNPAYDGGQFPTSAGAQDAFAAYVRHVVQTFGNDILAVEVWNEPNGVFNYGVPHDQLVAPYVSLCGKVRAAVRSVRTDIPVLGGASVLVAYEWHKRLVAAGILPNVDGISFHPYGDPEVNDRNIQRLKQLVGTKPLWATEFGVTRNVPGAESAQSHFRKTMPMLQAHGLKGASAYLLRDDAGTGFGAHGLITQDGAALTEQGTAFRDLANGICAGTVTKSATSPLMPLFVNSGNGRKVTWIRLGGKGKIDSTTLTPNPVHRRGAVSYTGPAVKAELIRDWRGSMPSKAYQNNVEVALTEGGFPYETRLNGPVWAFATESQLHPSDDGVEAAHRWVSTATATYLVHLKAHRFDPQGDGVTVRILARGVQVWTQNLAPGASVQIIGRVSNLTTGQPIEVRVGTLGGSAFDATGIEFAVTANATVSPLAFNV